MERGRQGFGDAAIAGPVQVEPPEMVARVAKVIDPEAWGVRTPAGDPSDPGTLAERRAVSLRKAARAIAVMGRPTQEMRQATFLKFVFGEAERLDYWRGMLRIALKPKASL